MPKINEKKYKNIIFLIILDGFIFHATEAGQTPAFFFLGESEWF